LLIVGSIEPRKNHRLAFDAFNAYRKAGGDWDLVVVGRAGWHCDGIISEMMASPGYGQTLHWFDDADDALLACIYREAGALIIPSHIEGFGLPLVEGAHWGRSVIASDIPVFREIGEDFANFFEPTDAAHLAARLWEAQRCALPKRPLPGQAVGVSWQQSVKQFAEQIADFLRA
jgi:glycosyltransferase involved in cell wall biosynthesis